MRILLHQILLQQKYETFAFHFCDIFVNGNYGSCSRKKAFKGKILFCYVSCLQSHTYVVRGHRNKNFVSLNGFWPLRGGGVFGT